jgi:hypothetical protein
MKFALTFVPCALAALTLCSIGLHVYAQADSPIVVSDGSTHLRHSPNFQTSGTTATVNESGRHVTTLTCTGPINCGSSPVSLKPGWSLDVFDAANARGNRILTLTSANNALVSATFTNSFTQGPDTSGDTTNGTDLGRGEMFTSARLTNGGGPTVLNCTGHTGCKILIHYEH